MAIHAHRAFRATFTRGAEHDLSTRLMVAKFAKLISVDRTYIGVPAGGIEAKIKDATIQRDSGKHSCPETVSYKTRAISQKPRVSRSFWKTSFRLLPKVVVNYENGYCNLIQRRDFRPS